MVSSAIGRWAMPSECSNGEPCHRRSSLEYLVMPVCTLVRNVGVSRSQHPSTAIAWQALSVVLGA